MTESWQKYPLLRILIPFVLGMVAADGSMDYLSGNILILFVVLCLCAVVLYMQNVRKGRDRFYTTFGLSAMAFFFLLGTILFGMRYEDVRGGSGKCGDAVALKGCVMGSPVKKTRTWAVELATQGGRVLLYVDGDSADMEHVDIGDSMVVTGVRLSATCPLDLEAGDSVFHAYRSYLFYSGIVATGYVRRNCWTLHPSDGFSVRKAIAGLRSGMAEAYREHGMSGDEGALIEALTTGDKTVLPKSLKEDYSRSGVSHVLALSGFHLAVIYAMLNMLLLGRLVTYRWRWLKSLAIVMCLWLFTLLAGAPPSLVRAAVMCSLMSLSVCLGRDNLSVNSLALAAAVMLVYNPLTLLDVGFQLSFVSVLGICVVAVPVCRKVEERAMSSVVFERENMSKLFLFRLFNYFVGVVVVSVVCTLFTAPLVAYHFHAVPLLSVVTNLLVSGLAVVLLYAASLWWLFFWWEWVRDMLGVVLDWVAGGMNSVAGWIASVEWGVMGCSPSALEMSLWYCLIGCGVAFAYHRRAWHVKSFLLAVIALCVVWTLDNS